MPSLCLTEHTHLRGSSEGIGRGDDMLPVVLVLVVFPPSVEEVC